MMSDMIETKLIKAVRGRDLLYNNTLKDFRDVIKKQQTWNAVAAEIGVPVKVCMQRWSSLRDRYSLEKRREITESVTGDTAAQRPPWKYMEVMRFIDPFVRHRSVYRTLEGLDKGEEESHFEEKYHPENINSEAPFLNFESLVYQNSSNSSIYHPAGEESSDSTPNQSIIHENYDMNPSKRRRILGNEEEWPSALVTTLKNISDQISNLQDRKNLDSDDLLGLQVAAALRAVKDPKTKIDFRRKFYNLIGECEATALTET